MKLFIGCAASSYISHEYFDNCQQLLHKLFKDNDLVFGGCGFGLMGLAYEEAKNNYRDIIAISPEVYLDNFKYINCNVEVITNTINERTEEVISSSDVLVFLPGGIGTIYELFTAIECRRAGEHNKPIIIYNCNGFFDGLLFFMDKLYGEGFTKEEDRSNYLVVNSSDEVIDYINNYKMNNNKRILKK